MTRISKRLFLKLLGLGGGLLTGLASKSGLAEAAELSDGRGRILHGPMLGLVTPGTARIWCRANERFGVSIAYGAKGSSSAPLRTKTLHAAVENNLSLVFELTGLEPDTHYCYEMLINGERDKYLKAAMPFEFRTPAQPDRLESFSVAFGSCARYAMDPIQPIWNALDNKDPDLFLWLGDNVYGDTANPGVLADEYKRQRSVPTFQRFASRVPQLAIWDDHDFSYNDSDRTNPSKQASLAIFKSFWPNPSFGLPDTPGVFFQQSIGGVDFFFLDVRYYRDPNDAEDSPSKTMLGAQQFEWLRHGLSNSSAPFKILVSGSGWSLAKGHGGDSWASFVSERNRLFDFIRDESIEGVVLVSGDTHVAELNAIPWSENGGYDFYDLTSSPLAQPTSDSWLDRYPEMRIRQAYFGSNNFGLMTFDLRDEPTLAYNVIDTRGEPVWGDFRIRADELKSGVASWRGKMDGRSKARYERAKLGEPYYQ